MQEFRRSDVMEYWETGRLRVISLSVKVEFAGNDTFTDWPESRSKALHRTQTFESKTTSVGSVSRIPATEIEDVIIKSLREHVVAKKEKPTSPAMQFRDRKALLCSLARINIRKDHLAVQLTSGFNEETSSSSNDHQLSIPWQKPPSRKPREILLPRRVLRSEVRPTRIESGARLVSAIARGRRWLGEVVSGSVTDIQQIATRQKCSVRQVNMTI